MKTKNNFIRGGLIIIFTCITFYSYAQQKEDLIGKWVPSEIDVSGIQKENREDMKEIMGSVVYIFKKSGQSIRRAHLFGEIRENKGAYEISKDGKSLVFYRKDKEEPEIVELDYFDKNRMTVSDKGFGGKVSVTFIKEE